MTRFSYKFEKNDFKLFLEEIGPSKYKTDNHIFWIGRIPLPEELLFRIFKDRNIFFELYLDHVFVVLILSNLMGTNPFGSDIFELLPDTRGLSSGEEKLFDLEFTNNQLKYLEMAENLRKVFLLEDYNLELNRLKKAYLHAGKKYNRLYIHSAVKTEASKHFPHFLELRFQNQADMFGNLVADHYDIYRSGLSDALAGLFNSLLEFTSLVSIASSGEAIKLVDNKIEIKAREEEFGSQRVVFEFDDVHEGTAWEPTVLKEQIGIRFDTSHPLALKVKDSNQELLILMINFLSELEFQSTNEKQKKIYENLRKELSRRFRVTLST